MNSWREQLSFKIVFSFFEEEKKFERKFAKLKSRIFKLRSDACKSRVIKAMFYDPSEIFQHVLNRKLLFRQI